jgi:outer membrane protein
MNKRFLSSLIAAIALMALVAPGAIAADLTDVGFVDQSALGSLPQFVNANEQLAQYKAQLDAQFASQMKAARTDADKQSIALKFQQLFQSKQSELVGPLFQRAQLALATVAGSKKLSIVVDKRIIVYGGQDITSDVINTIKSAQALQPASAPPASSIGYVDENALDGSAKVKDANDKLQKFTDEQRPIFQAKVKNAKTDVEKNQVAADFQKTVADKRDELLKPLVDQTKSVTASVARGKNLMLVIDRGDVVFGGTDITVDVQNALK